ncbi:MAG: trans-aconitate 2-methyltransferase [Arthrobacter sp.]|uniref:trans-aconitate 2-methyltransferase n=1 Tax=Arthrobacter sp. TaxID=1667 RepID=UPI003475C28A
MRWDPAKYTEFSHHRDRPFFDLTSRVAAGAPGKVVDLGCGPGRLTAALAERWPAAEVAGLDASAEMIRDAAARYGPGTPGHRPRLSFAVADAGEWEPGPDVDVLVTNAMLQWIPGHLELVARWLDALRPGAWFAAQVPGNFGSPSHVLLRRLAESPRWAGRLAGILRHDEAVAEPAAYLRLLLDAGFEADAWETTYQQVLVGADPVLDWVRGTGLRPVLSALGPAEAESFEREYGALLRVAYPAFAGRDGSPLTVFPFRRIFCVGRKAG